MNSTQNAVCSGSRQAVLRPSRGRTEKQQSILTRRAVFGIIRRWTVEISLIGGCMADEKKEPWLNYLALTTVIFAVCATLSTLKGGGYGSRAVMSQSQASDQWAFFQSKSIKGYVYDLQKEKFEMDLEAIKGTASRSLAADYHKK